MLFGYVLRVKVRLSWAVCGNKKPAISLTLDNRTFARSGKFGKVCGRSIARRASRYVAGFSVGFEGFHGAISWWVDGLGETNDDHTLRGRGELKVGGVFTAGHVLSPGGLLMVQIMHIHNVCVKYPLAYRGFQI